MQCIFKSRNFYLKKTLSEAFGGLEPRNPMTLDFIEISFILMKKEKWSVENEKCLFFFAFRIISVFPFRGFIIHYSLFIIHSFTNTNRYPLPLAISPGKFLWLLSLPSLGWLCVTGRFVCGNDYLQRTRLWRSTRFLVKEQRCLLGFSCTPPGLGFLFQTWKQCLCQATISIASHSGFPLGKGREAYRAHVLHYFAYFAYSVNIKGKKIQNEEIKLIFSMCVDSLLVVFVSYLSSGLHI